MGAYFTFNDIPHLEQNQILYFAITPTEGHPDFPGANFISGMSRVVRIDSPSSGDYDIGVALEFLSKTLFNIPISQPDH
jgi:hypothetical protein